jgi:imidazolonepropionase-like amidohydrolase
VMIKKGVDVIKLIATGGMATQGSIPNAPQLTEEQMRVACAEAERVGIITGAHCTGLEGAQNAIRAGVRSVEHAQLDEETVAMMREKGTFYCPTIITRARIIHSTAPELQWLRDKAKPGDLERKQKAVRLCHEAGVKIAAATDTTGGLLTPIGVLADEIILYTECGLSVSEALQTATKTAAELCKIEDMTGTLTVGKCADLVLLDGNPLENPQTLKNVELTYRNGQLLYKNY